MSVAMQALAFVGLLVVAAGLVAGVWLGLGLEPSDEPEFSTPLASLRAAALLPSGAVMFVVSLPVGLARVAIVLLVRAVRRG